jgi:hypothetical protein
MAPTTPARCAHVAADHHVLEGREVREEADVLEGARDAERGDAIGGGIAQRPSLEQEAALVLLV